MLIKLEMQYPATTTLITSTLKLRVQWCLVKNLEMHDKSEILQRLAEPLQLTSFLVLASTVQAPGQCAKRFKLKV